MSTRHIFTNAIRALNRLHLERTGTHYRIRPKTNSNEARKALLEKRVYDEKIEIPFMEILRFLLTKKKRGKEGSSETLKVNRDDLAKAIVIAADICLRSPEIKALRKSKSNLDSGSAHYNLETNERLPFGDEDIFQSVQMMERRFVCDKNLALPASNNQTYAFILGQTFDHEDAFWKRKALRAGKDNFFTFGVAQVLRWRCLRIQRLSKNVVEALYNDRNSIPEPSAHFSERSRWEAVQNILGLYLFGKDCLDKQIAELRPFCTGSYQTSKLTAERCAARLLYEDSSSKLRRKVREEWRKFFSNDPNVLGDTLLIQNALYFNAAILTGDAGAEQMAQYCGLSVFDAKYAATI